MILLAPEVGYNGILSSKALKRFPVEPAGGCLYSTEGEQLLILYIKWNFVRGSCPPFFRTVLQYCTVVQICCTCAVNKNTRRTTGTKRDTHHRHKKGTHPKAAHWGAKNMHLLLHSKHIAPKPCIARAPEFVFYIFSSRYYHQGYLQNLGTTKRSNMKKNRYEVWKQTFSELDFETLRLESAALGNSLNARQHRSSGRNKPYSLIEDCEVRQSIASFFSAWGIYLLHCRGERPFATCLRWGTGLAPAPSLLRIIAPILRNFFH